MLEVFSILTLIGFAVAACLVFALVVGALKLLFKVAFLPFTLIGFLVKGILLVVGAALLFAFFPVVLAVGLAIVIPLLVIGALIWAACGLVAAVV